MHYHLEELDPKCGSIRNFHLRVFDGDPGPIDHETGQPWKKYAGMCHLQLRGRVCEIKAILHLPDRKKIHPARCLALLRGPVADDLDLISMWGERWDAETKTKHVIWVPLNRSIQVIVDAAVSSRFQPVLA